MKHCPICDTEIEVPKAGKYYFFDCPVCGGYKINKQLVAVLKLNSDIIPQKYILSGLTREAYENKNILKIDSIEHIKELNKSSSIPDGPIEQIDLVLLYISNNYGINPAPIKYHHDYPIAFTENPEEFRNLLNVAANEEYLKRFTIHDGAYKYQLTLKSLNRLREIKRFRPESNQAFVAMPFDEELKLPYDDGIRPAIEKTGYKPIRLDYLEYNEKIDDKIIAEIRKSSLLIADLTYNNPGVYFEAGMAMGLGIEVFWTCREDHIDNIHFDTRQFNCIVWKNPEDLKRRLINRIEAIIPLLGKRTK